MARSDENDGRIFTKKVDGGDDLVRRVYTPQDEVEARWDGFTETSKTTTKPAGGAGAGTTNSAK
jgi:hypothetical protein